MFLGCPWQSDTYQLLWLLIVRIKSGKQNKKLESTTQRKAQYHVASFSINVKLDQIYKEMRNDTPVPNNQRNFHLL